MLNHPLKIIPLIFLPILVQADEVSNFWCNDILKTENSTCTVIEKDDSEAERNAKYDNFFDEGLKNTAESTIPWIIAIEPNQAKQGEELEITLTVENIILDNSSTIEFNNSDIDILSTKITDSNTLVAKIKVASNANLTPKSVYVLTGEEKTQTLYNALIIMRKLTPGNIQFANSKYQVRENIGNYSINVKRLNGSDGSISVNYVTNNNTAESNQDFTSTSGVLTWKNGDTEDKKIELHILDDKDVEENETFTIKLYDVNSDAKSSLSIAEIIILNDDKEDDSESEDNGSNVTGSEDNSSDVTGSEDNDSDDTGSEDNSSDDTGSEDNSSDDTGSEDNGSDVTGSEDNGSDITGSKDNGSDVTGSEDNGSDVTGSEDNDSDVTGSEDDGSTDTDSEIPIINTPSVHNSSPTKLCPERDIIYTYCTFGGREIDNITITENASVSNGILAGTMENDGWVSNFTLEEKAILAGGILTGYIKNNGKMTNFDFRGASIIGGTLGGNIFNNSPINGIFEDVYLEADTHITGGELRGDIIGLDSNYKALLEHLIITGHGIIQNVIIGEGVEIADTVMIDESVEFAQR
ncbi:Calx-beta domain-containing protein [Candidatus Halobeggiatoa sp. HSG11]|nr:Calx-beta domain-containing protein [Candidatus Halobeggiatoa sp. HSG11]